MSEKLPLCPMRTLTSESAPWCMASQCAWWIKGEDRPGGCCIPRLAHYAAAFLKLEAKMTAMFEEKHEWDRRDRSVHPIGG